jgi:medium-chain acyl-[acyl-carrier-protein] hydrolase
MIVSGSDGWIVRFRQPTSVRARLICFPYAGGSSSIYSAWHQAMPADVDVCAVELPGHGARMGQPCIATGFDAVVDQLTAKLRPLLDVPYLFFGHSMGAVLAFACARALRRRGLALPAHVFVSARRAPHLPNPDMREPQMTDAELTASLRARGGTPPEILNEPELLRLMLPIVRADFALLSSYVHIEEAPLECPLTVFGGTGDSRARHDELLAWQDHAAGPFAIEMFDGGHFFVKTAWRQVASRLTLATRAVARQPALHRANLASL